MMNKKTSPFCIVTDTSRCIACHACVAHCKIKNAMPEGIFLGTLLTSAPSIIDGVCVISCEFQACYNCEKAWCMAICPSGAIKRDTNDGNKNGCNDGTVWIDANLCTGCGLCTRACPWHIPKMMKSAAQESREPWDANAKPKRIAVKCDHCRDLRSEGLKPACVTACTAHALQYMPLCDAPMDYQERYARRMDEVSASADAFVAKIVNKRAKL